MVENLGNQLVCYEDAIWLGSTISALLEDQEGYVLYSKLQIRFLLNTNQREEARTHLEEWEAVLPEDLDIQAMKNEISSPQEQSLSSGFW